jgi:hypothetical protein
MARKKHYSMDDLMCGDTIELISGADAGMRGIVQDIGADVAWIAFAADGEDTRRIGVMDIKITNKA